MNTWVKFKDELPPDNWDMWVSDGKAVWPFVSGLYGKHIEKALYWMDRINPAPPEKEKHRCVHSLIPKYYCQENGGRLYIHAESPYVYPLCTIELEVKYCPFCAFTLEEK